jgi:hypothetical protein
LAGRLYGIGDHDRHLGAQFVSTFRDANAIGDGAGGILHARR